MDSPKGENPHTETATQKIKILNMDFPKGETLKAGVAAQKHIV